MPEEAFHDHLSRTGLCRTATGGSLACDLNAKHLWHRTTHHPSSWPGARVFKSNR